MKSDLFKALVEHARTGAELTVESIGVLIKNHTSINGTNDVDMESYARGFHGAAAIGNKAAIQSLITVLKKASPVDGTEVNRKGISTESYHTITDQPTVGSSSSILGIYGEKFPAELVTTESFENAPSTDLIAAQAQYNYEANTQDAFSEMFYRPVNVDPGVFGKVYVVEVASVYTDYTHTSAAAGASLYAKLRNIADAYVDSSILRNASTSLVPIYNSADAAHASIFVEQIVLPNFQVDDQHSVVTRPLTIGLKADLLKLSEDSALINQGVFTSTDRIADSVRLKALYFRIGAAGAFVKLDTSRMAGTNFHPSSSGNTTDMSLDFIGRFRFSKDTRAVDGAIIAEFDALPVGHEIVYTITATGRINVETGYLENGVNSHNLAGKFHSAKSATATLAQNDATIAAAVTVIETIVIQGYELDAARTNANLRTTGLISHSREVKFNAVLNWKAPISAFTTLVNARKEVDTSVVSRLSQLAKTRNTNQALEELQKHAQYLEQQYGKNGVFYTTRDNEAQVLPAGYFVMPYYKEYTDVDLTQYTNSTKSHERNLDIQAALLNFFRMAAVNMLRGSRYDSALRVLSNDPQEMPNVIIGTDQRIHRYLMESGDVRTMGPNLTFQVESSPNSAMYETVYMSFARKPENRGENDILSFGEFLVSPEIIGDYQVSVGGATINRAMVFPRNHHQSLLPVLVKITFNKAKFDEAVAEQLAAPLTPP